MATLPPPAVPGIQPPSPLNMTSNSSFHPPPASPPPFFSPPAPPPAMYGAGDVYYVGSLASLKQLNFVMASILVILVVVVLLLSLSKVRAVLFLRRTRRLAGNQAGNQPAGGQGTGDAAAPAGVPENMIESLGRVFEYSEEAAGLEQDERECTVCLGDYKERDSLRQLLVCGHTFHKDCIDAWLKSRSTCPLCRAGLLDAKEGEGSSSSAAQGAPQAAVPSAAMLPV